jgi:hypothetical protein
MLESDDLVDSYTVLFLKMWTGEYPANNYWYIEERSTIGWNKIK